MYNNKVTVFTPAYNRGYIIGELYESLKNQTCKEFEWLVVDDGSVDNTEALFSEWMKEDNEFTIRYYKKENGGKHRAVNHALDLACGELFYIVDSDDILTENSIERVIQQISELPVNGDVKYAGICNLKGYYNGGVVGTTFEGNFIDCTVLERDKNGITGVKAEVIFTEILRKYPFPEFDGENFITEAVVWDRIAKDGYHFRFFNEINYLCEYREDGLTKQGLDLYYKNPLGYCLYLRQSKEYGKYTKRLQEYFEVECYKNLKKRIAPKQIADLLNVKLINIKYKALYSSIKEKLSYIKNRITQ
jgi:glycosyltransferase involved in cell wall biosynthesis